jgi:hypothetical protein
LQPLQQGPPVQVLVDDEAAAHAPLNTPFRAVAFGHDGQIQVTGRPEFSRPERAVHGRGRHAAGRERLGQLLLGQWQQASARLFRRFRQREHGLVFSGAVSKGLTRRTRTPPRPS